MVAQIPVKDSRYHEECRVLPRLLLRLLGQEWLDAQLLEKEAAGRLWMPVLTTEEVDILFQQDPLARIRGQVQRAIRYWDDAQFVPIGGPVPFPEGELFFVADEWYLVPATAPSH